MPIASSIHATQRALPVTSRMFPFFLNHISSLAHFLFSGLASCYSRHHFTFYFLFPTKPLDYLAYKAGSSLHCWLKAHFYSTCYWTEQMCGQDTSGLSQLDGPFLKLILFWIYTINPYFSLTLIFLWLPQLSGLFSFSQELIFQWVLAFLPHPRCGPGGALTRQVRALLPVSLLGFYCQCGRHDSEKAVPVLATL